MALLISVKPAFSRDLQQVKEAGVLRHIGIPYANFVSYINKDGLYSARGLDVELMQGFAQYIGVDYQFVPSTWSTAFGQLTGREASSKTMKFNTVMLSLSAVTLSQTAQPYCLGVKSWSTFLTTISHLPFG
ncbi:extracellular solute binding protein scrB [Vibrio ishigakensis]|uniref:Extracellular solute binding protein scrB n=1 Tax=Vibrio ishigakensis TaxID=1481914 RepID=A0A0B8QKW8_9VIBR|nr:extracellular solute binding protein scrB [Vibrio ishigakensis]